DSSVGPHLCDDGAAGTNQGGNQDGADPSSGSGRRGPPKDGDRGPAAGRDGGGVLVRATLPKAALENPPAGRAAAAPGPAGPGSRVRTALVQIGPPALLLAAIVGAWEWGVAAFDMPFYVLPAPSRILALAVAERALLWDQAAVTLLEIFVGFGIALVVGIGLALLIV